MPCSAGSKEPHAIEEAIQQAMQAAQQACLPLPLPHPANALPPCPGARLMGACVLRRQLALVPTLVLASLIVFVTIRMIPGDVIDLMLSQNDIDADKLSREQLVQALGLGRSMPEQYLRWVWALLHGDLGNSLWQSTPVLDGVLARLPVTLELGAMALVIGLSLALGLAGPHRPVHHHLPTAAGA